MIYGDGSADPGGYYAQELAQYGLGDGQLGSIFSAIGKVVKGVGKAVGKVAKVVLKPVAKVASSLIPGGSIIYDTADSLLSKKPKIIQQAEQLTPAQPPVLYAPQPTAPAPTGQYVPGPSGPLYLPPQLYAPPAAPEASKPALPSWVIPAGIGLAAVLLLRGGGGPHRGDW